MCTGQRARIAADPHAAMMASRTGRLHLLRLAGTTDAATTRPILERLMAERTAAQAKGTRAKGPPDDGSRPLPGDDDDDKPKDPEEPKDPEKKECPSEALIENMKRSLAPLKENVELAQEAVEKARQVLKEANQSLATSQAKMSSAGRDAADHCLKVKGIKLKAGCVAGYIAGVGLTYWKAYEAVREAEETLAGREAALQDAESLYERKQKEIEALERERQECLAKQGI